MSLKVWLPLINDFNNQGTYINNPTNSGATVSTTGPLGGSYSFDGTDDKLQTTYVSAENTMTVCMWVNFSKFNVHLLDMRNSSGTGYQPAYVSTTGVQVGGSSNNQWPYINYTFSTGTWYHLGIVYSSSKTQLYVNGTLAGEASNSLGYNYNMTMEVHIGSRYSSSNWFQGYISDFRIYNEALSAYEVKVISQGLLLHYTRPDGNNPILQNTPINDSSGFGRNATPNGTTGYVGYRTGRYNVMWNVGSSDSHYYSLTSPSASTNTISFWLRTPKTASTVFFADYKSKLGFGFNASGYIITSCDSLSTPMFTDSSAIPADTPCFIVLRKTSAGTGVELFINGVQKTNTTSSNYWTHSTDTLMIGRRSSGSPMNCYFSDFRMYGTRLSDSDILDLYHTSLKQLSNGKSSPFEILEDTVGKVQVVKNGLLINNAFVESTSGNKFKATQVISNEFIER